MWQLLIAFAGAVALLIGVLVIWYAVSYGVLLFTSRVFRLRGRR
jgi:hypothetical protein